MPILTIRLPTELHARFMEECDKRDIRASELGRQAIELICQHMVDRHTYGAPSAATLAASRSGRPGGLTLYDPKTGDPLETKPRLVAAIRGFALDGSALPPFGDRLKQEKKSK